MQPRGATWQISCNRLVKLIGCRCAGVGSLVCLKALETIWNASLTISNPHMTTTSSYTWAPVIDGSFLKEPLSTAKLDLEYGMATYDLHEGENFAPAGLQNETDAGSPPFNSSEAFYNSWLRVYLPNLSPQNFDTVKTLYPEPGLLDEINLPRYLAECNTSFERARAIYRDSVLACPALRMASSASRGRYLIEYTIRPARHASDVICIGSSFPSLKFDNFPSQ
jgi:hypothetical protein